MPRILVADDQYEILQAIRLLLKQEGFQTVLASSPGAALNEARASAFDLVLIDLNYARDTTSGREGLDMLAQLREIPHLPPVIVMTAWSTVPLAVEAMRLGAADFIEKPWDNSKLLAVVHRHLQKEDAPHTGLTPAKDLEIARNIQNRLLPHDRPDLATLEYAVNYSPAGQVGGDYYDFLPLGSGEMAFVVADVSGKGISAAILMATVQSFFRSRAQQDFSDLRGLVRSLNTLFFHSSPAEHYATLFVMRYSDRTRKFDYVNCGHTPPLLLKNGHAPSELAATATVLGLFESWSGSVATGLLDPGDSLLIFSDGITEASNHAHEEFGAERLLEIWNRVQSGTAAHALDQIARAIRAHTQGSLTDDLTILALRGRAPAKNASFEVVSERAPLSYEARCCT